MSALISGRNQVDTFLEKHRAAGIQHIGLYTKDIVSTAQAMAEAGVQFFSPPFAYYTEVWLTLTEQLVQEQLGKDTAACAIKYYV